MFRYWVLLALNFPGLAAMVELRPATDTSIHQISPANNMGGHTHVAIGVTAKETAARGLFRFDVSGIPANATVSSATIIFNLPPLNRTDRTNTTYAAHRMLAAWGEGTKQGNLGAAASAGEATWTQSASPATWGAPGGQAGVDFAATASATEVMGPSPGVYAMSSTAGLVGDVRHWIANPAENFGWLLKAEDESLIQTARQFSSRETTNAPVLRVEYSVGPAGELKFTSIERVGTNVVIWWTGGQGSVAVEAATDLMGLWAQVAENEAGVVTNGISGNRGFLRLRVD